MNDSGGQAEARRLANEWVSKLTGVTAVPLDKGWLAPKLAANEPDALMNLEGRHNVVAHSLDNLSQFADFAATRKQQLPAILINGWIGYFWWELRQDLEAGLTIKTCERCGNVIRCGHRDRRFCTRDEDIDCFRTGNREAQRRRRNMLGASRRRLHLSRLPRRQEIHRSRLVSPRLIRPKIKRLGAIVVPLDNLFPGVRMRGVWRLGLV